MKIILAGGTGFLGRPLCRRLMAVGHQVVVLTRQHRPAEFAGVQCVHWQPDGGTGSWLAALQDAAAVVNLTGESLAGGRWTASRKRRLRDSRLLPTRSLVEAIRNASRAPAVFLNASAVGYYGGRGDELVTESTPAGDDFAARLCVDWEAEALRASTTPTRVALIRTAPVLGRGGGLLARMALPFELFVGGPLGSGQQFLPWIHLDDWVRLMIWMLEARVDGAVNACAPTPVTNIEFSRALGAALGRPSWLRAPAPAVRLALGEMAAMVLTGQRAVPQKAMEAGFQFEYGDLGVALRAIYR